MLGACGRAHSGILQAPWRWRTGTGTRAVAVAMPTSCCRSRRLRGGTDDPVGPEVEIAD